MDIVLNLLKLAGSLGVFLYGMKVMSEALQKVAGSRLKQLLGKITSNRVAAVFTGFLITCVVQSSSATTVMVVSFVNAQLLSLMQAIGVVMGANIGTTLTAWLVALLGFKVKITSFAVPAVGLGVGLTFLKGAKPRQWGEVLIGFGFLFLGLSLLKGASPKFSAEQLSILESYSSMGLLSTLLFVGLGTILTVLLQSSSATMALTLTMTAAGIIPYESSIAMVLGENIGTTATANFAAIGTSAAAKRTARVHLLFNVVGVCWAIALLHVLVLPLVDAIVPGDPMNVILGDADVDGSGALVIGTHLAAFHSVFNITNTIIMLPLVGKLADIAKKWVPEDQPNEGHRHVTRFISTAMVQTPELLLVQVGKEMQYMARIASDMFSDAMEILAHPEKDMGNLVEETLRREQLTDDLEREISAILTQTARAATSASAARRLGEMALNTHRLERIGDHCEKLVGIAIRNHNATTERIDKQSIAELREFGELVGESLHQLGLFLADESGLKEAEHVENRVNAVRDRLRDQHIERMQSGKEQLVPGLWVLDMVHHLEEIGDRAIGIARRAEETKSM